MDKSLDIEDIIGDIIEDTKKIRQHLMGLLGIL
jgi:hypothetical protein